MSRTTWVVAVAMVAGCSDGAERFEPISLQFRPVTGQSPAPCASSSANPDPAPDPNSAIEVADERLCFTLGPSMLSPIRVRDAAASEDPTTGVWFLDVALTEADARTFADVTRTQRGEQLAVVVDGNDRFLHDHRGQGGGQACLDIETRAHSPAAARSGSSSARSSSSRAAHGAQARESVIASA